ncbi:hypothetical protein U1Q18_021965 [Sarracenia purpurea var. burkii]
MFMSVIGEASRKKIFQNERKTFDFAIDDAQILVSERGKGLQRHISFFLSEIPRLAKKLDEVGELGRDQDLRNESWEFCEGGYQRKYLYTEISLRRWLESLRGCFVANASKRMFGEPAPEDGFPSKGSRVNGLAR